MPRMAVLISACGVSGCQLFGFSLSHRCASVVRLSACSSAVLLLGVQTFPFQFFFLWGL